MVQGLPLLSVCRRVQKGTIAAAPAERPLPSAGSKPGRLAARRAATVSWLAGKLARLR